jgi:hypothetical protein
MEYFQRKSKGIDSLGKFSCFAVWNGGKLNPLSRGKGFSYTKRREKGIRKNPKENFLQRFVELAPPCKAATPRVCPTLFATQNATVVIKKMIHCCCP